MMAQDCLSRSSAANYHGRWMVLCWSAMVRIMRGMVVGKRNLVVSRDHGVEWVGRELVITLPQEDVVVLNESAGIVVEAVCCGEDPVQALCSKYNVSVCQAESESNRLIGRLRMLGLFRDVRMHRRSTHGISRRLFVSGAAAFGVSLLSSEVALGEELADKLYNGSPLGEWKDSSKEVWIDSLGNEVAIPSNLTCVAPYGPYARAMLESIGAMRISSVTARGMHSSSDSSIQLQAAGFAESVGSVPAINQALVAEQKPSLILDIGDSIDRLSEDVALGIKSSAQQVPVVYVLAGAQEIPQAFRTLANLLDAPYANELADYAAQILATFAQGRERLLAETKKRIYYGQGVDGLSTRPAGTLFDDICVMVGLENIAASLSSADSSQVDPSWIEEQEPDLIVISSPSFTTDSETEKLIRSIWLKPPFRDVSYIVPCEPFSWLDRSPLTMQTLGALWLANLAYPDIYDYSMVNETVDYFDMFFHISINCDEAAGLINVGLT
jgi:iron complex transport system substrate-binding protein